MKKKHSDQNQSFRTLGIFIAIVIFLVMISLAVKMITLLRSSTFDGRHGYIVAVQAGERTTKLITFNPGDKKLTTVVIKGKNTIPGITKLIGIIPDGTVRLRREEDLQENVGKQLFSILIGSHTQQTSLTPIDVLYMLLSVQAVPSANIQHERYNISPTLHGEIVPFLFQDSYIAADNKTIEIVNATGSPGVASRLELVLTNIGANIIAVTTAPKIEQASTIRYFGEKTYTVDRINRILHYREESMSIKSLSDIMIIIGKDVLSQNTF